MVHLGTSCDLSTLPPPPLLWGSPPTQTLGTTTQAPVVGFCLFVFHARIFSLSSPPSTRQHFDPRRKRGRGAGAAGRSPVRHPPPLPGECVLGVPSAFPGLRSAVGHPPPSPGLTGQSIGCAVQCVFQGTPPASRLSSEPPFAVPSYPGLYGSGVQTPGVVGVVVGGGG